MAAPSADPPLDFSTFVVSLASSALAHLGHVDEGHGHPNQVDLKLARQSVDLLEMLHQKTRGNLDADEQHLIEAVLRELREKSAAATRT